MTFSVTLIVTERQRVVFLVVKQEAVRLGSIKNAKGFTYHSTSLNCTFLSCFLNIFLYFINYFKWYLDCTMSHSCKGAGSCISHSLLFKEYCLTPFCFFIHLQIFFLPKSICAWLFSLHDFSHRCYNFRKLFSNFSVWEGNINCLRPDL